MKSPKQYLLQPNVPIPENGKDCCYCRISIPQGFSKLMVAPTFPDRDYPTLWAVVDDQQPEKECLFRLYGDGEEIDEGEQFKYLGSCICSNGGLVWHVVLVTEGKKEL